MSQSDNIYELNHPDERRVLSFKRSDVPLELLGPPNLNYLLNLAFIDWSLILVFSFAIFHTPVFSYPLWLILIAGRIHGLGVICHELSHLPLKQKSFKVRLLEVLTAYPIATSADAMAYHHIRHHRNTLLNNDPYFNINKKCSGLVRFWLTFKKGLFFVPFWIFRSVLALFATWIPALRNPYARIWLQDVSGQDLRNDEEVKRCIREDHFVFFFHASLFLLSFKFEPIRYCYYFALPAAGVFCIYRLLIEHEYDIVDNRSVYTMIDSTFDHHMGLWGKLFFGPHNIGYHCMHHIHPQVGLQYLPGLRNWYMQNVSKYARHYTNRKDWSLRDDLFGSLNPPKEQEV